MLEKLSSKDLQKLVNRTQGSVLHKIYENRDRLTSDELVISKHAQDAFKGKDFSNDSTSSDECPMTLMPISERVWVMYNNNEVSKYPFESEAIERWYKAKGTCPVSREPIKKLLSEEEYKELKPPIADELFECFREYYSKLSEEDQKIIDNAMNSIIPVSINKEHLDNILLFSTQEGNLDHIKEAIRLGANINTQNNYDGENHGDTPLFIAAQLGHKEIVEYLLANGADANIKNNLGRPPLLAVIYQYQYNEKKEEKEVYLNVCKQLLKVEEINVNIGKSSPTRGMIVHDRGTEEGETPLYMAAKYGCLELVKLILGKGGVDVDRATEDSKKTPLLIASQNGHDEVIGQLIEHGTNIEAIDKDGNTSLHIAAKQRCTDVMQLLVGKGANIHAENNEGETPLGIAEKNKIAEYCFKNTDIKNTNIFDAIENGDLEGIQEAINAGQIEAVNDDGKTPLCVVAEKGNTESVGLLIKNNAKVNTKVDKDDNCTPLHYAAQHGHIEAVKLLIKHGADPNAEDKYGDTPSDFAEQGTHTEIKKFLEEIRVQPVIFTGQQL